MNQPTIEPGGAVPEEAYADMVRSLAKPGLDISLELTPVDAHLWHMATGIAGEAGELLDAVKKAVVYRKELNRTNLIEELGDLEFYMEGLRQAIRCTRADTLRANVEKLLSGKKARYAAGSYSDAQAQARADKAPGE